MSTAALTPIGMSGLASKLSALPLQLAKVDAARHARGRKAVTREVADLVERMLRQVLAIPLMLSDEVAGALAADALPQRDILANRTTVLEHIRRMQRTVGSPKLQRFMDDSMADDTLRRTRLHELRDKARAHLHELELLTIALGGGNAEDAAKAEHLVPAAPPCRSEHSVDIEL